MSQAEGSQVAWVFDLNKCMGCPTCSIACHDLWTNDEATKDQWWNTISTEPAEGHPKGWRDMGGGYDDEGNLVLGDRPTDETTHDHVERTWDPNEANAGDKPEIPLDEDPDWTFNWEEDEGAGEHPNSWHFYMPKICMHCSKAPCVEACPEDAIIKRDEDGIVYIDEQACDGNRYCQRACPYKVIWYNEDLGGAQLMEADEAAADGGASAAEDGDEASGISQMCMGCIPRVEEDVAPACARTCPGRAVHFGELGDDESSVHRLVREWEVALPLLPDRNTDPNVYYVPPLSSPKLDEEGRYTDEERIPRDYLRELFGDGVDDALATIREERQKRKDGEESELIDTLVGYRWPDDFFHGYERNPQDLVGE